MGLFAVQDLEAARQRVEQNKWMQDTLTAIRKRVDSRLETASAIPAHPGGWIHDYICPHHLLPLEFNPASPHHHRCPQGELHQGEALNAAWRAHLHRQAADLSRDAALVWVVTGDRQYARLAAQILLAYAGLYGRFDAARNAENWMLKGRAFSQALTEALWAVPLAQAFDLVRPYLPPDQQETIRTHLLRPVSQTLAQAQDELAAQNRLQSNYMAWLNTALGCLGFVLDDTALVERAIDGLSGFYAHLNAAILPDGFEYERTPYYHNFVALAYTILAEAARANGTDLYAARGKGGQSIEAMWHALAAVAWPDGSIPALNDGSYWQNSIFDTELCTVYEIALARSPRPEYAWLLRQAYCRRGTGRDVWPALLWGGEDIQTADRPEMAPVCLPHAGIALLRQNGWAACVPFGPSAGSHSHRDRLALQVWPLALDAGTPLYGVPERRSWYQQTPAHSVLLVDGQPQTGAAGRLSGWEANGRGAGIWLSAAGLYPDVWLSRHIALVDHQLTDLLVAAGQTRHTYDWLLHLDVDEVQVDMPADHEPVSHPFDGDLARLFTIQKSWSAVRQFQADMPTVQGHFQLTLQTDAPMTVFLAQGPGRSYTPTCPRQVIIARTEGLQRRYLAVWELSH